MVCTHDHMINTTNGFKKLSELKECDIVISGDEKIPIKTIIHHTCKHPVLVIGELKDGIVTINNKENIDG